MVGNRTLPKFLAGLAATALIAAWGAPALAQSPAFMVAALNAAAGDEVTLPIHFQSGGNQVCAVSADVSFDPSKLGWVGAQAGPAGQAAGKNIISQPQGAGAVRLALIGMNPNPIGDGVAFLLKFHVDQNASGTANIQLAGGAADCSGRDLPTFSASSAIVIKGTSAECQFSCNPVATPVFGEPPLMVTFVSQVETTCPGQVRYTWNFGDGSAASEPNPGHTYRAAGEYSWSVEVVSGTNRCTSGGTISVLKGLTLPDNEEAAKAAEDAVAQAGGSQTASGTGAAAAAAGTATGGDTDAADAEEDALEPDEKVEEGAEKKPLSGKVVVVPKKGPSPLKVALRAAVTGGKPPYTYKWEFGDETAPGAKKRVVHPYAKPGTYKPSLEVKDAEGEVITPEIEAVTVTEPPVPELAKAYLVPTEGAISLELEGKKFQKGAKVTIGDKKYDTEFADEKHLKVKKIPDPKDAEVNVTVTNPYGKPSVAVKAGPKPAAEKPAAVAAPAAPAPAPAPSPAPAPAPAPEKKK